jgi:EAL domain-containing protein (putative c-di-GMP-specific phosphodiesterase class I)
MAASREHNDLLQWLRARGVRIAIDDFGVGYSSLDYLRRFPVDRIKIAQDFVEQIATASGAATIVKATIGLARELGIEVIAEGIETLEQLELLAGWRCREGQGFYFAPPLLAEDLTPLLSRGRLGARSASATDAA